MFISSMLCPICKKGEMEERSVITGILDSNSDIKTELICNACNQRLVQASPAREYVPVSEKLDSEKI
jgi:uncharacterized protein YlaI